MIQVDRPGNLLPDNQRQRRTCATPHTVPHCATHCSPFQVQGLQGYIAHKKDLGLEVQGLQRYLADKKGFGFEVWGLGLTVLGVGCGV